MRKLACLLIFISVFLFGCSFTGERIKEPVTFYYLQNTFPYQEGNGIIGCEEREASGHRDSLSYLLALYQMGPSSEELKLPFPLGTVIVLTEQTQEAVTLTLGKGASTLSDAEFSLACACLTMTCTELVQADRVTVTNGERSLTMTKDTITLLDSSMINPTEDIK